MLHLFNKIYVDFDSKINVNIDRVVISETYGVQMLQEMEKYTYGKLIRFAKNLSSLNCQFDDFIVELKEHVNRTNKKVIIYCDRANYGSFIATWFSFILPSLDYTTFKDLADLTIYNKRCIANNQMSTQNELSVDYIFESFDNEYWENSWNNKISGQISPEIIGINVSYEFLLANYLAGDKHYISALLKTAHLFLRRFFQEILIENRQLVLLNINNHYFQECLGFVYDVNLNDNPLENIEQLQYYNDEEIWSKTTTLSSGIYGSCKLQNLSQEKIDGLRNTLFNVISKFEGAMTNAPIYESLKWLEIATREEITELEFIDIIKFISKKPFYTCFIPRFDFENVNFPLVLHILKKYNKNDTDYLQKFIIHRVN